MATNKQLKDSIYNLEYLRNVPHEDTTNKGRDQLLERINELIDLPKEETVSVDNEEVEND